MFDHPELNERNAQALEVWRLLDGRIDWPGLLTVCEVYDVTVNDDLVNSLQMLSQELGRAP